MQARRASWQSFSAAPHRLFLWSGAVFAVVAVALWVVQQASLYTAVLAPIPWQVPYPAAHGTLMVYGVLAYYLFGFLLTTFPRWLDDEPVPRRVFVPAWALVTLGTHVFWSGLLWSRSAALVGCASMLLGYGLAVGACLRILLRTRAQRTQQVYITYGLLMGILGLALTAWAIGSGAAWAYRAARWVGMYPFLLQVVLTVVYRMVPFFTSSATPGLPLRRSAGALPVFTVAIAVRALLGYYGVAGWTWVADGTLLAMLVREAIGWRFWHAAFPPLLAVLYYALGWIAAAFALGCAESLAVLLDVAAPGAFRNAALHALTVGGFGSLLLGISSRVTLGHSGAGLATGRLLNTLFVAYQLVPLARVVPEIAGFWVPALAVQGYWSGLGWVVIFTAWLVWVGPALLRPRLDGRPG